MNRLLSEKGFGRQLCCCILISALATSCVDASVHHQVTLTTTDGPDSVVTNYLGLLSSEISRRSAVTVSSAVSGGVAIDQNSGQADVPSELVIQLHTLDSLAGKPVLPGLPDNQLPSESDPGPEGFLLCRTGNTINIVGVNDRGVLYGIGELLRQTTFGAKSVEMSEALNTKSAPAFEVRGMGVGQGHTITELTESRHWTEEEWQRAVVGYALAGANTVSMGYGVSADEPHYQFVRSLGLKVQVSLNPNQGSGEPEWAAQEAIGRTGYLCLSIPEARTFKLEQVEARWKDAAPVEYVRMKSGDGGGCECERCRPYGAVYIEMCHHIANIIHKYQPETQIFVLNQKLDNDGDEAIFRYLQEHPGPWMRALAIGPGSNAMGWMPGRRQDHRMDLFRYPSFGAMDRYYREMLKQIPPAHDLVFFTDVTHWVYAQNGLMDHALIPDRNHDLPPASDHYIYDRKPDPALVQVYNRRAFNARPKAYYDFFRESMRYGIGDINYSEGHHDHFNSWMWQRLLWAPDVPLNDVILEYCAKFFGTDAAPLMAQAIVQFEDNLQADITTNNGIRRFADLVRPAGELIPANLMKSDYLWRQYMQRAWTDLYIQSDVVNQRAFLEELLTIAGDVTGPEEAKKSGQLLRQAIDRGVRKHPDAEMWHREARRLGRESDASYGVQIAGMFNLDQDYVGLGWTIRQIEKAEQASDEEAYEILQNLADYEMTSRSAFYDDLGDEDKSPHVTHGWPFGDGIFDTAARRSQTSCAFTTDEEEGVTLEYEGLDPDAQYVARMTLVRPDYLERFGIFQHQTGQSILADEFVLADEMELPKFTPEQFEFVVPKEATADGRLKLWCRKQSEVGEGPLGDVTVWRNTGGWGTLLSEVWLYKQAP